MRLLEKSLVMVVELNELIKVYDNALSHEVCCGLVDFFEENSKYQERIENQKKPNFTQINITDIPNKTIQLENLHNYLVKCITHFSKLYIDNILYEYCFPYDYNFEQFRIKKYNNNGNDLFGNHVDVADFESCPRFLSFLWYLNDVEIGGETVFSNLKIKPKAGRLLIFPPLWMFPHRGNPPVSNTKYILSSYLHYI